MARTSHPARRVRPILFALPLLLVLTAALAPAASAAVTHCECGGQDEIACNPFESCFYETTENGCDSGLQ